MHFISLNKWNELPLFFRFYLFLETTAEMLKKIPWFFGRFGRRQKEISKLTDL